MTKRELILDCLIEDDETKSQIMDYFEFKKTEISETELETLLDKLMKEGLVTISDEWKDEQGEPPYSLTIEGREAWEKINQI